MSLHPTKLVVGWLTGAQPQDGLLVKTGSDSSGGLVGFYPDTGPHDQGPFLNVTYQGQSGLESDQSYDRYPLDDHLKLSVTPGIATAGTGTSPPPHRA